ncbi:MAG: gamma-glutamyltranspeptidase / glutathione hydrolase [Actinomycetota bacterium]|nr:gamma-glutamyltranspeptidase / glutathione hydrolase [Actinomycetota bacterium]
MRVPDDRSQLVEHDAGPYATVRASTYGSTVPVEPLVPFATTYAPNGMVCSVDRLASEAGIAVLRRGGTAADGAVATSAALAVTTQHLCGMGGDLFALVHHRTGAPDVLNASGRAGSGADPDALRAEGLTTMPFRGRINAVPVPGCVDGWLTLHERHGRLPLGDVLGPAIELAENGFPASPTLAASIPAISALPGADDYIAQTVRPGTMIRRPLVADALNAIATGGRDAWYGGAFGEGLLEVGAGEYTEADLARINADWVEALGVRAWGRDIWTVPPNSQGYLTLAGAWIAAGLPLPDDPDDAAWAHLLIESARQAAYDRVDVLHEHADGAALVTPDRLAPRRAAIGETAAVLGDGYAGGGTIHLAVVDRDRMGVSLIQSNAGGWGAGIAVPSVRVFLQNRGYGFNLVPGHPAEYGPGRRPPHTLSPALVTHPSGDLDMVIGTMGGDTQPQILLQLLARLLVNGESPARAVAAGRWGLTGGATGFDTWVDRGRVRVAIEGHASTAWADGLRDRGHDVDPKHPHDHGFGHAHVIQVAGDVLAGASDPRPRTGGAAIH